MIQRVNLLSPSTPWHCTQRGTLGLIFMRNVCITCYSYFMATGNWKSAKVTRFEECYNSIQSEADQPCIGTVRSFKEIQNQRKPLYFVHYEFENTFFNSAESPKTEILGYCGQGRGLGSLICKGWSCDTSFERLIKLFIRLLSYLYFCDALKWVGFGFDVPPSAYITVSDFIIIVDNCRRGSV